MLLSGRGECVEITRTQKGGDKRLRAIVRTVERTGSRIEEWHTVLTARSNWFAYGDLLDAGEGDLIHWTSDLSIEGDGADARMSGGVKSVGLEADAGARHYLRAYAAGLVDGEPQMHARGASGGGAYALTRLRLWNMRRLYAGCVWSGALADGVLRDLFDGAAIYFEARPSIRRFRRRTGAEGAELAFSGLRFDKISAAPSRGSANPAAPTGVDASAASPLTLPWAS